MKWEPTSVFLPGEFHGQRSLVGYSPWGHKESDMTSWLNIHRGRFRQSEAPYWQFSELKEALLSRAPSCHYHIIVFSPPETKSSELGARVLAHPQALLLAITQLTFPERSHSSHLTSPQFFLPKFPSFDCTLR